MTGDIGGQGKLSGGRGGAKGGTLVGAWTQGLLHVKPRSHKSRATRFWQQSQSADCKTAVTSHKVHIILSLPAQRGTREVRKCGTVTNS